MPGTRSWLANNIRSAELADVHAAVRIAPGTFGSGYRGPSFFDMLFGGGAQAAQPVVPPRNVNRGGRVSQR